MSRRSYGAMVRTMAREAARAERAHQQSLAREAKANAKETVRQHLVSQTEAAEGLTNTLKEREEAINSLLRRALAKDPSVNLTTERKHFKPEQFSEARWNLQMPNEASFSPTRPGFFGRMLPGASVRYERRVSDSRRQFQDAVDVYNRQRNERDEALGAFEAQEEARKAEIEEHNAAVNEMQRNLGSAEHKAVIGYYQLVIERSLEGEPDALSAEIGYSPDSKHLVVDLDLPDFSSIPDETGFRYIRAADRIDAIERPLAKRRSLYGFLLSQVTLKCIDTIFRAGPRGVIDCLTVNGRLDTIDPATGQQVRVCLLSVRLTADVFQTLNLAQVQPEHCLRSLKASVSRAPSELLPIKPLVELDMVDPRFVATLDVMSGLDERPNLMDLSPTEFEGLITNLFSTMGLDTRQTRPSRDGGVDCVAFDPRPVFGGKVVIQAKRYKNTVGVSAVRDLFVTVQNEGASKGILVTTSGYGQASFDFARGKPLELFDGANLLHLLAEHSKIDARIVMPDGWKDLPIHGN